MVKVGSAGYRKLIASGGTPSGWVAYEAARPETSDAKLHRDRAAIGRSHANPAASQQMLDDAMFDVEKWLAHEIASEFRCAPKTMRSWLIERDALAPISLPVWIPGSPVRASALNGTAECSVIPAFKGRPRKQKLKL